AVGAPDPLPGSGSVPSSQVAGHLRGAPEAWAGNAVRLGIGNRFVPAAPRGAALPLLPRVDALVSPRRARQTVSRRDRVRPFRAAKLQAPPGFDRRRR